MIHIRVPGEPGNEASLMWVVLTSVSLQLLSCGEKDQRSLHIVFT